MQLFVRCTVILLNIEQVTKVVALEIAEGLGQAAARVPAGRCHAALLRRNGGQIHHQRADRQQTHPLHAASRPPHEGLFTI